MEANVNQNILNEDPTAKLLIGIISERQADLKLNGSFLYHEFPLFLSSENQATTVNVLIVSQNHGLIIFQCDDTRSLDEKKSEQLYERLEQVYSQIYSRLIRSKILKKDRTNLLIGIKTFLFLPNLISEESGGNEKENETRVIKTANDLVQNFADIYIEVPIENVLIKETLSILEGSKGIIKPKQRNLENLKENSKARILERIETEIANFDAEQKRAALYIVDGPQRIRGLAGSGKTIVLAMKAALIHLREPDAEILYTFYTKSLYSFIKRLVTRFYREYSEKDPDWEKIHILHAWGGKNLPGVYYNACIENNIAPIPFNEVQFEKQAFNKICESLSQHELKIRYDYSILDEGQDFPTFFYRICRKLTKNNRVIWGYDECQNIFDIEIQDTKQTFGLDNNNQYYIDFSTVKDDSPCDLVLYKCYRNPRMVLVCAFSLGLGIYNNRILQLPENNKHWKDLGFEVKQGESKKDDKMVILRPEENSPVSKNILLGTSDVVSMKVFKNAEEEICFVTRQIIEDLKDGLLPEDILVISLDDRYARSYFSKITEILQKNSIQIFNLLEAPFYSKDFYLDKHITLTTVYRAKGNEAASVYIVGVDSVFENKDSIRERNKIFTAMTRTKAWVNLSGVGKNAELCDKEIRETFKNYPNFVFKMPDRSQLKIFQRDLSDQQDKLNKLEREIGKLADDLGISRRELIDKLTKNKKPTK